MERAPDEQWVRARLEAVAPSWTPDAALARALVLTERPDLRLDFTTVPLDTHVRTDGVHVSVPTLEAAAARAGFVPRLPSPDVVSGEAPALSVTSRLELIQTLRSDDLRAALARVGAMDFEVPDAWNGAKLEATIDPLVIAGRASREISARIAEDISR